MDMIGTFAVWFLTVCTITSFILGEIWRGKRSTRLKVRKRDAAKLAAWLAAPTNSPRSHRRSTT